jgi:hypothetical protein
MRRHLRLLAIALTLASPARAQVDSAREARLAWFKDAKYGLFIQSPASASGS